MWQSNKAFLQYLICTSNLLNASVITRWEVKNDSPALLRVHITWSPWGIAHAFLSFQHYGPAIWKVQFSTSVQVFFQMCHASVRAEPPLPEAVQQVCKSRAWSCIWLLLLRLKQGNCATVPSCLQQLVAWTRDNGNCLEGTPVDT